MKLRNGKNWQWQLRVSIKFALVVIQAKLVETVFNNI